MKDVVGKYLQRYAEPEAQLAQYLGRFDHAITIAACGEGRGVLDTLQSLPGHRTLGVLVINARENAPEAVHAANRETLRALDETYFRSDAPTPRLQTYRAPFGTLAVIVRTPDTTPFAPHQGVGLARKLGGDLILALAHNHRLTHSAVAWTDADAELPKDYFDRIDPHFTTDAQAISALVFPFVHVPADAKTADLIWAYDIWLRHYVLGLRFAGSPYAYHSLGSTIVATPRAYAQVRGVPQRLAGEDFYLLDKLRKVATVKSLSGEPIRLAGRLSERTPFGTGSAVKKGLDAKLDAEHYPLYHPHAFDGLSALLTSLEALAHRPTLSAQEAYAAALNATPIEARQHPAMVDTLDAHGVFRRLEDARPRAVHPPAILRLLHQRLDALRTLKVVHALRDAHFPNLPLRTALETAPYLNHARERLRGRDLEGLSQALRELETEAIVKSSTKPRDRSVQDLFSERPETTLPQ